jgi:hypothetical protein
MTWAKGELKTILEDHREEYHNSKGSDRAQVLSKVVLALQQVPDADVPPDLEKVRLSILGDASDSYTENHSLVF